MKYRCIVAVFAALMLIVTPFMGMPLNIDMAEAASFSSGRKSSPPPAAKAAAAAVAPKPSTGFRSGSAPESTIAPPAAATVTQAPAVAAATKAPGPTSAYTTAVNRQASADALKSYKASKADVAQVRQDPVFKQATSGRTYTPTEVRERRAVWERSHTVVVVQHSYPVYGMYNATFLDLMMMNAANNAFFYNHQNDWSVQAYLAEARQNDQLRAQVSALDARNTQLQASGTAVNPNYMPADVPPEVMYGDSVLTNGVDSSDRISGFMWVVMFFGLLCLVGGGTILYIRRTRTPTNPGF